MRPLSTLLFVPLAFLAACKPPVAALPENLSVAQAEALIQSTPDLQIIDVRSPGEHKGGYIKGARLIPIDEFEKRSGEVAKDKPAMLYCAGGGRSSMALEILKKQGYTQVSHLEQGFDEWKHAGKAFEK